jgi:hypothetical protein
MTPIHVACRNRWLSLIYVLYAMRDVIRPHFPICFSSGRAVVCSLDEGPEIVDAILSIDPLAAKHVDNLGQV